MCRQTTHERSAQAGQPLMGRVADGRRQIAVGVEHDGRMKFKRNAQIELAAYVNRGAIARLGIGVIFRVLIMR